MDDQTTTRVGDYEILGVLGGGGMGTVYKVRNVITDRVEAMKTLLPNLAGRQELVDRFLREIKLLAALNHPNIAALRTALTWENKLVMIMEFVEGVTLAARLEQGPIPPNDVVNYIDQVLSALGYAHSRQVIHRDIKPSNMMLTPQGVVKLMDFGIARSASDRTLTATGTTLGSLYYMSPEQVRGEAVDARSDLYSVGVSMYELVTGKRPFEADSDFSLMAAHLQKEPTPPRAVRADLPAGLNDVILRAMAKDPGQRFQSAAEFSAALQPFTHAAGTWQSTMPQTTLPSFKSAPVYPVQGSAPRSAAPAPSQSAVATAAATAATSLEPTASQSAVAPTPQSAIPAAPTVPSSVQSAISGDAQPPASPLSQPPVPVPPSRVPATGHRGLYITLGAMLVLFVLVAAALYSPLRNRIRAATEPLEQPSAPANTDNQTAAPAIPPAPAPAPTAESAAPAKTPPAAVALPTRTAVSHNKTRSSRIARRQESTSMGNQEERSQVAPVPASSPAQPDSAQLAVLDHSMALLSARADSVNASLDNLRQVQAGQGLGLRGDIASSQERMKLYLNRAQTALQNQDSTNAKRYLDLAETEVNNLEKFLGR